MKTSHTKDSPEKMARFTPLISNISIATVYYIRKISGY